MLLQWDCHDEDFPWPFLDARESGMQHKVQTVALLQYFFLKRSGEEILCILLRKTWFKDCDQGDFRDNLQTMKMLGLNIGDAILLSLVIIYLHFSLDDSPFLRAGRRENKKEQIQSCQTSLVMNINTFTWTLFPRHDWFVSNKTY